MSEEATPAPAPVIIDLGKQKKKKIKRLQKGKGRLLSDVESAIEQLKAEGAVQDNAQPVYIIVREKPEQTWKFKF